MCDPVSMAVIGGGMAVMSSYQQYQQAKSEKEMADYSAKVSDQNAKIREQQALDAQNIGADNASAARQRWQRANATLRAVAGSGGVNPDTGTFGDLQDQNIITGETDVQTVLNNAQREAWGFKTEATNFRNDAALSRYKGKSAMYNGMLKAGTTLVTGLGNAYGSYASSAGSFGTGEKVTKLSDGGSITWNTDRLGRAYK